MRIQNIYISLLVFASILVPAAFFFQETEALVWMFEIIAFAASFTVLHALKNRDRRRKGTE